MKRAIRTAAVAFAAGIVLASAAAVAAPPPPDAPVCATLASTHAKELHWGMTHDEVIDTYNRTGTGIFDRQFAPLLVKAQPGVAAQQLQADRDTRKANFERSLVEFKDSPTGFDVGPLQHEYTYHNDEAVLHLTNDGKTSYFFFIKDKLWKIYEEVDLKAGGPFGDTYQAATTKLNGTLGIVGRFRQANPGQGVYAAETDWQDKNSHYRADDRSSEHKVGLVLEDKHTLANLSTLRANKATDPFALDPAIANVTKNGVSDPNAVQKPGDAGGTPKGKKP